MPCSNTLRRLAIAAILALAMAGSAWAGEAAALDLSWRDCLSRSFHERAALTGREPAAAAAFRACRGAEAAYLAALAASPLLDEADIARAGPALASRARDQLLASSAPGRRAALP